jgi:nitrogen-specific signal transduction histidine kinase
MMSSSSEIAVAPVPFRLLEEALAPLSQCACVYDREGHCLFANCSFARWMGKSENELIGKSLFDLWPVSFSAREGADLHMALKAGRMEQLESRPGAMGPRQVRAVKFPWRSGDGFEAVVVVFDEAPMANSLSHPDQFGWLALGIVHDFNNTLTMLCGQVERLANELGRKHPGLRELSQLLEHACALPQQLLSFVRNDPPSRQVTDLHTLLRRLEGLVRSRIERRVSVELRLEADRHYLEADPVQLTQAFLNLSCNALDAMPEGGRLLIRTTSDANRVEILFQDTGVGMNREVLSRIFERMYTTRPGGSGLGLMVVGEVIRRHAGRVTCRSTPGEGSCFVIDLPLSSAKVRPLMPAVVVVDPEPDIAILANTVLTQVGYRIHSFSGIREARDAIPVDVAIVDASVLDAQGAKDLDDWLAQVPEASLIVTSAGPMPVLTATCRGRLREQIDKPYTPQELVQAVQRVVG